MTMDLQQIAMWGKGEFLGASDSAYEGQFETNLDFKLNRICGALIYLSTGCYQFCEAFAELGKRLPARRQVERTL
jgi:hypothetical protein